MSLPDAWIPLPPVGWLCGVVVTFEFSLPLVCGTSLSVWTNHTLLCMALLSSFISVDMLHIATFEHVLCHDFVLPDSVQGSYRLLHVHGYALLDCSVGHASFALSPRLNCAGGGSP